jgi:alanine dehydrogenase
VDQGGCIETTHPTTHDDPVYQVHGVTHYCVANMPGAVPRTSTQALTNVTFPYVKKIARLGLENSASEDPALRRGINIYTPEGESRGMVTCEGVALAHGLPYVPCEKAVAGLWVS